MKDYKTEKISLTNFLHVFGQLQIIWGGGGCTESLACSQFLVLYRIPSFTTY